MLKHLNSVLGVFVKILIWKSEFYSLSFGPLFFLYYSKFFENCDWCTKVQETLWAKSYIAFVRFLIFVMDLAFMY